MGEVLKQGDLIEENKRLAQHIDSLERINEEQRETIDLMEENSGVARQTIEQLRVRTAARDQECVSLRKIIEQAEASKDQLSGRLHDQIEVSNFSLI